MEMAAETLACLDSQIAKNHLLLHPFYRAWTAGRLPGLALVDYARQYYHHVAAFPMYLSALHSHTEDPTTRRHILSNLTDEEAGHPNHPELWLQFAEALGVTREEMASAQPWPETRQLVGTFRSICREESVAAGLAALYAYESQIPKIAEAKLDGLRRFYGLTSPQAVEYFEVHIEADREHSRIERQLLARWIDPTTVSDVFASAGAVLDRLWDFLFAVGRRYVVCETLRSPS